MKTEKGSMLRKKRALKGTQSDLGGVGGSPGDNARRTRKLFAE